MRRVVLVAVSAVAVVSEGWADEMVRAPLRGSEAPSYKVDFLPRFYPQPAPLPVAPPPLHPAETPVFPPAPNLADLPFRIEVGARFWWSSGKLTKSLFDLPDSSTAMVSRLSFKSLTAQSGEVYARFDHPTGFLIKGYGALGRLSKGNLNDEDFTPFIDPYSSTISDQREGHLHYATVDVGYNMWNTPQASLAAFVGYNFLGQEARAFGCTQAATNPFVCVPDIDRSQLVLTEDANIHSLRLGLGGELRLFDRLRVNAEAAWIPFARVNGTDNHWLRLGNNIGDFSGGIPETGHGDGVQIETSVAFQATKNFSLGAGWRYWRIDTKGTADFGGVVVGIPAASQPLNFTTERNGFFVQGAYRL